jgi:hypothetical protein
VRLAALALVALALAGCETTAEKSAKLEKAAKLAQKEAAAHGVVGQQGLSVATQSRIIKVGATQLLRSAEGTAVVVTLHNTSAMAQRDVPIAITLRGASGAPVYSNNAAGLSPSLVSAPLIAAHGQLNWIDDQIQPSGTPVSVTVRVGEGKPLAAPAPQLSVEGAQETQEAAGPGAEGKVLNHSPTAQQELVVFAVASRAGAIVAAGRAVIPEAAASGTTHFQLFFIGDPRGAQVQYEVPPTAVG